MSVLKINSRLRNVEGGWSKNTCTAGFIFSGIISSPVGHGAGGGGPLGRIIRSLHDTEIKYLVCQTNTKCIQIVDLMILRSIIIDLCAYTSMVLIQNLCCVLIGSRTVLRSDVTKECIRRKHTSEIMSAIQSLNPKAEFARASQALAINISAAKGLQDVLKTNLGPKGTMKM